MSSWKDEIPEGWEWRGVSWKGKLPVPVYVFRQIGTNKTKGFSGWQINNGDLLESKKIAVTLLRRYLQDAKEL